MKLREDVYRCGKCGICIQTCPVFHEELSELTTPRGKMQLMRNVMEGQLPASKRLQKVVSTCLMCGSCTFYCPSGIDHEALYMSMRKSLKDDHGEDWKKRLFFYLLNHEQQLKLSAKIAAKGQNAVFEKLYKDIRLGNIKLSSMPKLNGTPFRSNVTESNEPAGKIRGTVLYFVGCSTNFAFESIGNAVIKILTVMGLRVKIIRDQVCCGLPMYLKGELDGALENAEQNIDMISQQDVMAVITDCATCCSALTSGYAKLMKEMGKSTNKAVDLAEKTIDISRFILRHFDWLDDHLPQTSEKIKITYHEPCHERNHGGSEDTITLLKKIPYVEFIQSEHQSECCGGGGTFFYDFPELSKKMVDRKIEGAKKSGADFWATGCPGCRINLNGNLTKQDGLSLIHPAELIAKALQYEMD